MKELKIQSNEHRLRSLTVRKEDGSVAASRLVAVSRASANTVLSFRMEARLPSNRPPMGRTAAAFDVSMGRCEAFILVSNMSLTLLVPGENEKKASTVESRCIE